MEEFDGLSKSAHAKQLKEFSPCDWLKRSGPRPLSTSNALAGLLNSPRRQRDRGHCLLGTDRSSFVYGAKRAVNGGRTAI